MQEKRVIAAEYRGLRPEAGELLCGLRREFRRMSLEIEAGLASDRRRLAGRIRNLKQRAARRADMEGLKRMRLQLRQKLKDQEALLMSALLEARRAWAALALAVAEEVLGEAVKGDHTGIVEKVKAALAPLAPGTLPKVLVNQANLHAISAALPNENTGASPEIGPGNALIKTASGEIEIQWRDHLAHIRAMVEQQLSQPDCSRSSARENKSKRTC